MRIKAESIDETEFVIRCPECKTEHTFVREGFDKWILDNGDDGDYFTINTVCNQSDLWPWFVCKNPKCAFSNKLSIVNWNQKDE